MNKKCTHCGITQNKFQKKGILCDLKINNGAHSFQVVPEIPSGVTGWKEYGIKYGYWNYFSNKIKLEELQIIVDILKKGGDALDLLVKVSEKVDNEILKLQKNENT
jgi:hypothetical protein